MMRSRPQRRRTVRRRLHTCRAFTLLELLLASFIVSLLMLSLYTALHAAFKARVVMNSQAARVRSARIALDLVEQDLRSILPPTGTLAGPFTGTASEIDCYTLARDYGRTNDPLADGMRYVNVLMDATGDTPALVQKVTRNLLPSAPVDPETEVLATDVNAFTVRYYDGSTWTDSWDSSTAQTPVLPVAVEVTVTVQTSAGDPPYAMTRLIPLPCGVNVNNTTSTAAGTSIGGI